jgi:hypothetical protein
MPVSLDLIRLFLSASLVATLPVITQTSAPKPSAAATAAVTQIVSMSPISLVFGIFGAEYERRMSPTTALAASGTYARQDGISYL